MERLPLPATVDEVQSIHGPTGDRMVHQALAYVAMRNLQFVVNNAATPLGSGASSIQRGSLIHRGLLVSRRTPVATKVSPFAAQSTISETLHPSIRSPRREAYSSKSSRAIPIRHMNARRPWPFARPPKTISPSSLIHEALTSAQSAGTAIDSIVPVRRFRAKRKVESSLVCVP